LFSESKSLRVTIFTTGINVHIEGKHHGPLSTTPGQHD
jgi:hypothetical protein